MSDTSLSREGIARIIAPVPIEELEADLAVHRTEQEYTDEQTGMRLTIERDGPYRDNPRVTVFPPEPCTLSIEEGNAAIQRLLVMAGLMEPEQAAPGGKP